MEIDVKRFETAKKKVTEENPIRNGIGTLKEKTIHAVLKNYYAPDIKMQEIPIEGYVADIFTGMEIYEIQTRQFDRLRKKLETFLPKYPVTICYPIPRKKWLIWIDEETGELSSKRKSPVTGNAYMAFKELYKIKMFLNDPNLHFKILLLDMEEYRLLNGWSKDGKKGSDRFDRIPLSFEEEIEIEGVRDYLQFVPYTLREPFTSKEFAESAGIKRELAQVVLNLLTYTKTLERVGKEKRSYLYKVCDTN